MKNTKGMAKITKVEMNKTQGGWGGIYFEYFTGQSFAKSFILKGKLRAAKSES